MVKGEKLKEKVFSKKIGFGLFKLIGFNPETNAEIEEFGGYVKDNAKEPKYIDTVKNEKTGEEHLRLRLDFYMEEVNNGYKYRESFFLEDFPSLSKEIEGEPRKNEYINTTGLNSWQYTELDLSEKFQQTDYHHAIKGEFTLIDFLKKLMNLEWKAEISYDFKRMFKGHFKELKDDLASAETIIIPLTIKQEDDPENAGEIKEYQNSFKAYARGAEYKFVNLKGATGWTEDDIDALKKKEESNRELFEDRKQGKRLGEKAKWINDIDKVVLKMQDDEWGCKNVYFLGKIRDYEGDALPSTGKVIDETKASW